MTSNLERKPTKFQEIVSNITDQATDRGVYNKRTRDSLFWYKHKVKNTFKIPVKLPKAYTTPRELNYPVIGHFFMYHYLPKTREVMPYYDLFPLTLIIKMTEKPRGFLGLNFHYLYPIDRAKFMDVLYKFDHSSPEVINITYDILKGSQRFRYYKPCIKQYLLTHVQSNFIHVGEEEWNLALFLPTEKFVKKRKTSVWELSKEMY